MAETEGKTEDKEEQAEQRATTYRNEAIRLLQRAGEMAKTATERRARIGKKGQLTKSSFTYYAMAAERASKMKQVMKATDLYKLAAREAVHAGEHEDAASYLARAAEELRTDRLARRKTEIPRLYAQAGEESVHGSRIKDGIRYFEQAIEFAKSLGEVTKAMEDRVMILKARIGEGPPLKPINPGDILA